MTTHSSLPLNRTLIGVITALAVACSVAGAAGAATARYATGVYQAKAGHATFRFRVVAHSATNHCGTRSAQRCFIAISYPKIAEPCTNGQSSGGVFPIPNGFISSSGHFDNHANSTGIEQFTIDFRGSRATGALRGVSSYVDGSGTTIRCNSGRVKFTALRVG